MFLGLVQPALLEICHAAGTFTAKVADQAGQPAADAVVSLSALNFTSPAVASGAPHAVMDQRSRRFVPHVLPVQVGTAVDFPNSDDIRHHVYSFSEPKRFELPLYKGRRAKPVVFDRPGIEILGCNIHDWMLGYIYIADTPYFGKTDTEGNLRIAGLPAGRYEVQLWHPSANEDQPQVVETVQIETTGEVKREYVLELHVDPRDTDPISPAGSIEDKFKRWRN